MGGSRVLISHNSCEASRVRQGEIPGRSEMIVVRDTRDGEGSDGRGGSRVTSFVLFIWLRDKSFAQPP